ncbi:predicted protein [Sclerotinia sclerotiorum 1980 UF-70]|uniref:Uncharacterized protein n=1 Tax=Sclerotinia sclerotiorum (strain ATCC 18683 / 1980 / Ss-1) TaxID=665079 RepID=A7EBD1_SCLS1|nr:predicted protein [Sclerotinia sclerotiorum 1980 UF-70]EDN99759.1 predicted protein [Sclerotinia sclerotiorum 1980 UF-70]
MFGTLETWLFLDRHEVCGIGDIVWVRYEMKWQFDIGIEALVSTEFSAPNLKITRVHNARTIDSGFMTQPIFYITRNHDSGISMPDINVTDENILSKFGTELTANFADIKAHGSAAFFQKDNLSDGATYSLCACATGYIWVYISPSNIVDEREAADEGRGEFSQVDIQIGTFALRKRAITTIEIPCYYRTGKVLAHMNGGLALLCSTVLAKYLRFRMVGCQNWRIYGLWIRGFLEG